MYIRIADTDLSLCSLQYPSTRIISHYFNKWPCKSTIFLVFPRWGSGGPDGLSGAAQRAGGGGGNRPASSSHQLIARAWAGVFCAWASVYSPVNQEPSPRPSWFTGASVFRENTNAIHFLLSKIQVYFNSPEAWSNIKDLNLATPDVKTSRAPHKLCLLLRTRWH